MIRTLVLTISLGALTAAGCAGGKSAAAHTPVRSAPETPLDPVASSAVREKALELVDAMARDADPQLRSNAVEAASLVPARTAAIVRMGLKDDNAGVRTVAAMTVGRGKLAALTPLVRPLLDDPSPYVTAAAIFALLRNDEDVDRTPLAVFLMSDPSTRVRSHAAFILGEIGDKSAVPLLRNAAREHISNASNSEQNLLRLQIAEALVKLGDTSQYQTVRASLYPSQPEDLEATALGAQIIGQVQDRGAIDQLIVLTAQWEKRRYLPAEIRLAAASSLARMGLPQGDFIADEYVTNDLPALRAQCAFVYGETGKSASLRKLSDLMADPAGIVRISAAAAVLKIAAR